MHHGRAVTVETVVVDVIEEPVPGVTVVTEFEATEARQVSGALGKASFRRAVNLVAAPTCYEPSETGRAGLGTRTYWGLLWAAGLVLPPAEQKSR